jgi:hypothetical protein
MSSVIRTKASIKEGLTLFLSSESPAYESSSGDRLFPFSYRNGVLDITYEGNDFKSVMVDISGVDPSAETSTVFRITGNTYLVSSLGENFKSYIRAWRASTIDAGSPIDLYVAPQILRVQEADRTNVDASSGSPYNISTQPPSSDYYLSGSEANEYYKTYIFKTPLTFTIVESGVTQYITFRTKIDQED